MLPPRRRFCTEYCRTAVHRIRRTDADLARLRGERDASASDVDRQELGVRIERLEAKRAVREERLARRRAELAGPAEAAG